MRINRLNGALCAQISDIAADKSISHRCAIFSLLTSGVCTIRNYLFAHDCINTLNIIQKLGAKVEIKDDAVFITPPAVFKEPSGVLECGNSGTAMRLLLGFLAPRDGFFVLSGDEYLNERPMRRVTKPLSSVGAKFDGRDGGNKAPICLRGGRLEYFEHESNVSSAQVKTAMILAGLQSKGCKFKEPFLSRDHTERLLKFMGAKIEVNGLETTVKPIDKMLKPLDISVANDPSSAFFFAVAAAIIPGSNIKLKNILLNKTRIEAFEVLKKMGADIKYELTSDSYDQIGDITIKHSQLSAVEVDKNIAWLIDEAPALGVAFACAKGTSILKNASELRVKECDRIKVTVEGLKSCGIKASELDDGFMVQGGVGKFGVIDSHGDHRIAMSFAILGLLYGMEIQKSEFIATSFPNFTSILSTLGAKIED